LEYRESHFTHQVPGGMISNLRHQLTRMNMLDKLDAVLEEIVQVRKDFGYPIMVTPYSQFVGVQATLNVMSGQRYKELSDQTIQYAIGLGVKWRVIHLIPMSKMLFCPALKLKN